MADGPALPRRLVEQLGEVQTLRLPLRQRPILVEHLRLSNEFVEAAIAHGGHQFAHFLGDEEEEVDDMLGQADEALAQHRVLRRDADRTGVEMALAHHDAAGGDRAAPSRSRTRRRRASAPTTTSRPVRKPPSTCTAMRERSPFSTSV